MAVALVLAAAVVYANSLEGPFIFDDRGTILENTQIERLSDAGAVLSPPRETPVAGRPVVNATFAINYAIGGRDVTGYHVGNIAIHALCGLLLFAVLRRILQLPRLAPRFGPVATPIAWASALVWIVHPLNSEVMNYLSQRTESVMALCYLATLYASLRVMSGDRRRPWWTAVAVLSSALGMGAKESMVTAPVMVLVLDRLFVAGSWRGLIEQRWGLHAGLATTWMVLAALVATSPRTFSAGFTAHDADPWVYLLNQSVMIVQYLRLAVFPRDLVLFYGWPVPLTLGDVWPYVALVAVLVALTAVALVRWPGAGYAGLWFFVTLAPTSSVVPIATEVGAERRMYLPLMALTALATAGAIWLWSRYGPARVAADATAVAPPRWSLLPLAAIVVALGATTLARNEEYRSSLTLAETTVARWPSPAAHSMYGTELAAAGRLDDAERHLRIASPDFDPARYYLGTVLARQGRSDEAIAELQAFIASQPAVLDQVHLARAVLADELKKTGRWDEAIGVYGQMLTARPNDVEAEAQLAAALVGQGRFDEAIPHFERVLRVHPDDPRAHSGLGIALASTGRLGEAVVAFRRATTIEPRNARAFQNLARALLGVGDVPGALQAAERAVVLAPTDPTAQALAAEIRARTR